MRPNPKLFTKAADVDARLQQFGLTKALLVPSVLAGYSAKANVTGHHPASFPGTVCWAEATRELRDRLIPIGWQVDNTDNIPSVIHKGLNIKIAICNSTSSTGKALEHPQPKREKGDGSKRANFANQPTFSGFFPEHSEEAAGAIRSGFWYICIYCGPDEVRAELLCPIFDQDGLFSDFYERIFLVGENDPDSKVAQSQSVPPSPDDDSAIEINVTRKQAGGS